MPSRALRRVFLLGIGIFYLLHNDLWLWHDGHMVFGLPVGLTYHVVYCLATAALMATLVRWAWPAHLATSVDASAGTGAGTEHESR